MCLCSHVCVCLCLYILLWSVGSGFVWVINFLWLFFIFFIFFVSQKHEANQESTESCCNPTPAAGHKKKEMLFKKYIKAYLPYRHTDEVHRFILGLIKEVNLHDEWIQHIQTLL